MKGAFHVDKELYMLNQQPVGIFDSGVGGLTVARAIIDVLPEENLVYLGDTQRYPYGPRPLDQVREYGCQIMEHLADVYSVKFIVVACNTASAALQDMTQDTAGAGTKLRAESTESRAESGSAQNEGRAEDGLLAGMPVSVPVIGVIESGARTLVSASPNGKVGVIGTTGTISSGAYQKAIARFAPDIEVIQTACPGFVEFVERNDVGSQELRILAEQLLAPLKEAELDALLLGCTHYPFLAEIIGEIMGEEVRLVSSADETALHLRQKLQELDLLNKPQAASSSSKRTAAPERKWIATGEKDWFENLATQLLGVEAIGSSGIEIKTHKWV